MLAEQINKKMTVMQIYPLHKLIIGCIILLFTANTASAQTLIGQIHQLDSLGIPVDICDIETYYMCSEPSNAVSFCPSLCLEAPYSLTFNPDESTFNSSDIIFINEEIMVESTDMDTLIIEGDTIVVSSDLPLFVPQCLNFELANPALNSTSFEIVGCNTQTCDTSSVVVYFGVNNFCEGVWPGDINDDGIAFMNDLIYLGLAYNTFSSARIDGSIGWYPHPISDWNLAFDIGVNYKYADTNGDGKVNMRDTLALLNNYGTLHETSNIPQPNATTGSEPLLYFEMPQDSTLIQGTKVNIPIMLGTEVQPVEDIYGIAFSVNYDPALLEEGSLQIHFDNSLLGTRNLDMLALSKDFSKKGRIDIGLTGIDRKIRADKHGLLATMSFVLKDDIAGKRQQLNSIANADSTNFNLSFGYVNCLTALEESVKIATEMASVMVVSGVKPPIIDLPLRLFPNPTYANLSLNLPNTLIQEVQILNTVGQIVWQQSFSNHQATLNINSLKSGIYLVHIQTPKGILVRKISVL